MSRVGREAAIFGFKEKKQAEKQAGKSVQWNNENDRAGQGERPEMKKKVYAEILARTSESFGDEGVARNWLNTPCMIFRFQKPVQMLKTPKGRAAIINTLSYIEWEFSPYIARA